jgi:hypothetical protein
MTPFSLSIVAGNALAGVVSGRRRYAGVAVAGAVCMALGLALLTQLARGTPLVSIAVFVVIAGFGMGVLFTATAVGVQTVLPPTRLGAGFGVTRYLGQIGGVLGLALVGTVVTVSFAGALDARLPAAGVTRLASDGVRFTIGPQVLVSPTFYRAAEQRVAHGAAARVPPGPYRAARVADTIGKDEAMLRRAFAAIRDALAAAIHRGLVLAVLFCVGALAASVVMVRFSGNRGRPEN